MSCYSQDFQEQADRYARVCPIHLSPIEFQELDSYLHGNLIIDEVPTCNLCGGLLYWYVMDLQEARLILGGDGEALSGYYGRDKAEGELDEEA